MKLYDYLPSGNSYKVRLVMSYLDLTYTHVSIDIHKGESSTPEYLDKNPAGQIPLLELDDGRFLAESNAIMSFLAEGSDLIPSDNYDRAKMLQWMFWEQYKHEPAIAVARFISMYAKETRGDELPLLLEKGHKVLTVMNAHLLNRDWFVGSKRSLADIALYAYTHVADQGGFDMSSYKYVQSWLQRFASHSHHIFIEDKPS